MNVVKLYSHHILKMNYHGSTMSEQQPSKTVEGEEIMLSDEIKLLVNIVYILCKVRG
jgi:hypothetical protein